MGNSPKTAHSCIAKPGVGPELAYGAVLGAWQRCLRFDDDNADLAVADMITASVKIMTGSLSDENGRSASVCAYVAGAPLACIN